MELNSFWNIFRDESRFAAFTPSESEALFHLLVAAAFVDNRITNRERLALISAMDALPHFDEEASEKLAGDDGLNHLVSIGLKYANPGTREAFLDEIRTQLARPDAAATAFDAVVSMLHSDGVETREFTFCIEVGELLRIDKDTVREVVQAAWGLG